MTLVLQSTTLHNIVFTSEPVPMGETVVVHVIGTCDDNFRMWLMESGAATSSNQYNMQTGVYGGEFDEYIELTATDFDGRGVTEATEFNSAPTYDSKLINLTVTYCGIFYARMMNMKLLPK